MTTNYAKHFDRSKTPQSESLPGVNMVQNNAGGFVYAVDDWDRLNRWLLLGSQNGSYYATERKMTLENAEVVTRCLAADGPRTVQRIVDISLSGRAPKNDQAVFALAMAASYKRDEPDNESARQTRQLAAASLRKVCRIGTHLFQFITAARNFRGWGKLLRKAVANWYLDCPAKALAFQVIKYQQRDGFAQRDAVILSHPPARDSHAEICNWLVRGWPSVGDAPHPNPDLVPIWAFEKAKRATTPREIIPLIRDYQLPRECIPTALLNDRAVWDALLENMPLTAMIRNLGKMSAVKLIEPLSQASMLVRDRLCNEDALHKARVHPMALLLAGLTYASGRGVKGSLTWNPVPQVVDACETAFYKAFANVRTTGKNWFLGLDVSGSMAASRLSCCPVVSARVASAAMLLVTAAREPNYAVFGFTCAHGRYQYTGDMHTPGLTPLNISPKQRIADVCESVSRLPFGGTDCALPMLHAAEAKMPVDVFVIYTDNESWAGKVHASVALEQYRQKMGRPAKAICVGMTATEFSVLDGNDRGSLNVVGFDASAPAIMANFVEDSKESFAGEDDSSGDEA